MTPTSKKYIVKLTDDELKRLNKILRQKNTSETVANRIRILKDMDANHPPVKTYKRCASDHGISEPTITNVVKKFVNEGLDATIKLKRSVNSDNAQRKVDGRVEAKLLEVACGPVPKGHSRYRTILIENGGYTVFNAITSWLHHASFTEVPKSILVFTKISI